MNLLGAVNYDPTGGAAVSKATTSLLAMTAFDTTNLRIAFTIPAHGFVTVRLVGVHHGSTTTAQVLLGVLEGSTLRGRGPVTSNLLGTAIATTRTKLEITYTLSGLTPGAVNWDAAYGVEIVSSAGGAIKYGGPNDTTTDNAFGGFIFEVWDPRPLPTAAPGAVNGLLTAPTTANVGTADMVRILGTAVSAPATAGILDVNVKNIDNDAASASGTVTFPNATLASTTNITAGTVTTATNVTTVNGLAANVITAASTAADFGAEIATALWTDTTAGDFTVAASIGKSVMNGVALGTGLTINAYTGNTAQTGDSFARIGLAGAGLTNIDLPNQTMDITGNITGNLSGSVGSVSGAVGSVTGAVGSVTGAVGSVTGNVGGNVTGSIGSVAAGGIAAASFAAGAIDAAAIAADAITDAKVAADVTIASVTGAVGSVTGAVGSVTAGVTLANGAHGGAAATLALGGAGGLTATHTGNTTGSVGSVTGAVGSVTGNIGGNVTGSVGSVVGLTASNLDATVSSRASAADLATVAGYLDTEIAAILADTNELQTDWVNGGRLDLILDARASQASVDTIGGNVDAILVDTGTTLQAELDGIQADTEDIQTRLPAALVSGRMDASTGAMAANVMTAAATAADYVTELQAGLATAANLATVAGYLDTEVAAIKVKTDQLAFTVAGQVDANAKSMNDATIIGTGTAGNLWRGV